MKRRVLASLLAIALCLMTPTAFATSNDQSSLVEPPQDQIAAVCTDYINDYFQAQLFGVAPSLDYMAKESLIEQYCEEKMDRFVQNKRYRSPTASNLKIQYSFQNLRQSGDDLLVNVEVVAKYLSEGTIHSERGDLFQFRLSPANGGWTIVDVFSEGDVADRSHRKLLSNQDIATNRITQKAVDEIKKVTKKQAAKRAAERKEPMPEQAWPWDLNASYNFGRSDMVDWATTNASLNQPSSSIPYYDFSDIPGNYDCTNFISHAMIQGGAVRSPASSGAANGWYYYNMNSRSYSWSDVNYLYSFLTRTSSVIGPKGTKYAYSPSNISLADIVQIMYDGDSRYTHSTMVTSKTTSGKIYITSRSSDSSYNVDEDITTAYEGDTYRLIHLTTYTT